MKDIEIKLSKELKTKRVFNVFFRGKDTGFVGLESFKNGDTKRYPFYEKEGKIVQKYKSIKCITTTKKSKPKSGFSTSEAKGFGFTNPKGISNLFYFFQEKLPKVTEVIFSTDGETRVEGGKLFITFRDFHKLENQTEAFVKNKKKEADNTYQSALNKILPDFFEVPKQKKLHTR